MYSVIFSFDSVHLQPIEFLSWSETFSFKREFPNIDKDA